MTVNFETIKAGALAAPAFSLAVFGAGCESPPSANMQHFLWFIGHPEIFVPLILIVFGPIAYWVLRKFGRPRGLVAYWLIGAAFITAATLITGKFIKSRTAFFGAHDTYFITAHYSYCAALIAGFILFAIILFLMGKVFRRPYSIRLARLHFWLTLIGVNAVLLPQFYLAAGNHPRRYIANPEAFAWLNTVSAAGAVTILLSLALFIILIIEAIIRKRPLPNKSDAPVARTFD